MSVEEIRRRVFALMNMSREERPIPLYRFARLVGMSDEEMSKEFKRTKTMYEKNRVRYERVLLWVENNQVVCEKRKPKRGDKSKDTLIIVDPRPRQKMLSRVRITKDGPRLERVAVNPGAFPVLPNINK
jgi:hypothetical protein